MKKWNTEFYDNEIDNNSILMIHTICFLQNTVYKECMKTSNGSVQNTKINILNFW